MAATRTWFGGTGQFNNANDWTPTGVPGAGDTAIIETGTVKISNQGVTGVLMLLEGSSADTQPVLALRNAALDSDILVTGTALNSTPFGQIDVAGVVTDDGGITLVGGRIEPQANLEIDIGRNATFVYTGSHMDDLSIIPGALTVQGGTFINNGTVTAQNGGTAVFDTTIIGTGTFNALSSAALQAGSGFHFEQSVSSGITVDLVPNKQEFFAQHVIIDKPLQFLAAIDDFGVVGLADQPTNTIDLPNTPEAKITNETFADNQLKLFEGHKLVANLNIVGDFTAANFALSADSKGGTLITFTPAPAMASDPPPIVPSMAHS